MEQGSVKKAAWPCETIVIPHFVMLASTISHTMPQTNTGYTTTAKL